MDTTLCKFSPLVAKGSEKIEEQNEEQNEERSLDIIFGTFMGMTLLLLIKDFIDRKRDENVDPVMLMVEYARNDE